MIAASTRHLPIGEDQERETILARFQKGLSAATAHFVDPSNYEESVAFVQSKMSYTRQDVQDWFKGVRYPSYAAGGCAVVSKEAVVTCARVLLEAGVIFKAQDADVKAHLNGKYVDTNVASLV